MANNYYDATGVLVLDQVTPVISALFGRFRLDPTYPGNGKAYIARTTDHHIPQWSDVLVDLMTLAARLDLPAPDPADEEEDGSGDPAIEAVLEILASHFGAERDTDLQALIKHHGFQDDADLEALFAIATAFDDGHHLVAIEFEGSWYCSRPLLFEFGGTGCFLSREVRLFRGSSTALPLGQALRAAIVANDAEATAALIAKETQSLVAGISNDHFRMRVVQRVATRLLARPFAPDKA